MNIPPPQEEHNWLLKLVGKWTWEMESSCGPDGAPLTSSGDETVTALGNFWILGESTMEIPNAGSMRNLITLGFDPEKGAFVGTFISSSMTRIWPYLGSLNEDRTVLTLDSEGPGMDGTGLVKYQDIITVLNDRERMMTSRAQQPDGTWQQFMSMRYRRLD